MRARMIAVGVALFASCTGSERQVPPAKLAGIRVVDLIPASLSGETWQDAEPFLALYASNPRLMAASAFTPNPGGSASATAPIFVSDDGGDSWTLRNTLPSESMTADITHAVGGTPPVLYAGIMKVPGFPLNELKANDFFSPATMTLQAFRVDIDQPFVRTSQVGNADRVYIGLNDFDAPDGRTATVDVSLDGGGTYASRRIETRSTAGQNGPSIRPAVAQDHTVYVAYFGWRSNAGADVTSDVVVVRDDSGANGSVGLLYQQVTGSAGTSRWVTRLEQSRDGFATHQDVVLASVPATTPTFQFLPYIGDYNCLLTRGNQFLGIFSANNTPDFTSFPQGVMYQRRVDFPTHRLLDGSGAAGAVSIDPFFFSVPVLP